MQLDLSQQMQLDLSQKDQVPAAGPKSASTAKKQFPSMGYWHKRKRLVIHPRSRFPTRRAVNFPIASIGAEHHDNAYSFLSVALLGSVTRIVELLSDL